MVKYSKFRGPFLISAKFYRDDFTKQLYVEVMTCLWSGFSEDAKRKVISGITDVFTKLGVPREAVEVLIHEVPKENWGLGGEPASKKLGEVEPP